MEPFEYKLLSVLDGIAKNMTDTPAPSGSNTAEEQSQEQITDNP